MHTILDEIILGGQVLETSSTEVIKAVEEISKCYLFPRFLSWFSFSGLLLNKEALHHSIKLVAIEFLLSFYQK